MAGGVEEAKEEGEPVREVAVVKEAVHRQTAVWLD